MVAFVEPINSFILVKKHNEKSNTHVLQNGNTRHTEIQANTTNYKK